MVFLLDEWIDCFGDAGGPCGCRMDAIGLHIVGGEACKLVQIDEIAMLFPCHFGYDGRDSMHEHAVIDVPCGFEGRNRCG